MLVVEFPESAAGEKHQVGALSRRVVAKKIAHNAFHTIAVTGFAHIFLSDHQSPPGLIGVGWNGEQ